MRCKLHTGHRTKVKICCQPSTINTQHSQTIHSLFISFFMCVFNKTSRWQQKSNQKTHCVVFRHCRSRRCHRHRPTLTSAMDHVISETESIWITCDRLSLFVHNAHTIYAYLRMRCIHFDIQFRFHPII